MKKRIQPIKTPLVIGNWKLSPATFEGAVLRVRDYIKLAKKYSKLTVAAAVPFVFVSDLKKKAKKTCLIGGQDVSVNLEGAFTGDVAATMLSSSGADFSIVGHSERRSAGESDADVAEKVRNTINTGMRAVLCFGETERDEGGEYLNIVKTQLLTALSKLEGTDILKVILAYEPVWAVGRKSNVAITPHDLHQMVIFIKKTLREKFSTQIADNVTILYGGSANPENAESILFEGEVDGFLVGRASWTKESMEGILQAINGKKKFVLKLKKNKDKKAKR